MKQIRNNFIALAIFASLIAVTNFAQADPYIFWVNNNFDRLNYDADDNTNYEDGLNSIEIGHLPAYQQVPDYDYVNASGQRVIPCTRDLEDFARLWVAGVTPGLIAALPTNSTLTLSWSGVTGDPTIDLFAAANPGIGYQTNETIAAQQIDPVQCPYFGRISQTNSIQFTKSTWPTNQFIWCGVRYGYGALNLTIADGNGNTLVQTPVYLEIVDIKQMYERWTLGDNPNVVARTNAVIASDYIPAFASPFQYTPPQNTSTPYILFVHGWNMQRDDKDHFAETAFKRLYWQGYQGRFGELRWPTGYGFGGTAWDVISDSRNFDSSESNAWASATGLLNKLTDLNAEYPGNVFLLAHSMGNVVAGEALRLAGTTQVVNTYVAAQAAIVAQSYDNTVTNIPFPSILDSGTPNRYANYYTSGAPSYFNGSAGAGIYVNFFNAGDYALSKWILDQETKPDHGLTSYPGYHYSSSSGFYKIFGAATNDTVYFTFPLNTYEIFAFCDEARSFALGAQGGVSGAFTSAKQIDLSQSPYNYASAHLYHSLEFRADYPQTFLFWRQLLVTFDLR